MIRILTVLALLLLALPAAAQSPATAPAPAVSRVVVSQASDPALPRITAGHAAALGAGMFVGAMAGTAFINGGAVAALIGAAAGLTLGHWYWSERLDEAD